jgi:hypothetical protein
MDGRVFERVEAGMRFRILWSWSGRIHGNGSKRVWVAM